MEWLTTTTVLDRLRDANDASAWSSFVERFRAPITGFGRKLGLSLADAEDVAQETLVAFLESYRKDAFQRGRGRLGSYLFGIAHNKTLLARRKLAGREGQILGDGGGTTFWSAVPDSDGAEAVWEQEWQQATLRTCLEQVQAEVSPQTFEAFRLVVFERLAPAVVAERIGISRNAVFIAKHRVATRLRELRSAIEQDE